MTIPLDQARIDAFGQKMVETLNHAGLALMISHWSSQRALRRVVPPARGHQRADRG
jgi:hypothetical protein